MVFAISIIGMVAILGIIATVNWSGEFRVLSNGSCDNTSDRATITNNFDSVKGDV